MLRLGRVLVETAVWLALSFFLDLAVTFSSEAPYSSSTSTSSELLSWYEISALLRFGYARVVTAVVAMVDLSMNKRRRYV